MWLTEADTDMENDRRTLHQIGATAIISTDNKNEKPSQAPLHGSVF